VSRNDVGLLAVVSVDFWNPNDVASRVVKTVEIAEVSVTNTVIGEEVGLEVGVVMSDSMDEL